MDMNEFVASVKKSLDGLDGVSVVDALSTLVLEVLTTYKDDAKVAFDNTSAKAIVKSIQTNKKELVESLAESQKAFDKANKAVKAEEAKKKFLESPFNAVNAVLRYTVGGKRCLAIVKKVANASATCWVAPDGEHQTNTRSVKFESIDYDYKQTDADNAEIEAIKAIIEE